MAKKRRLLIDEDDCNNIPTKKLALSSPIQIPTQMKSMNSLFELPVELKVYIFGKLNFKDLSILTTVCKPFRDIIVNHFLLNKELLIKTFKEISKNGTEDYLQMSTHLGLLIKRSSFIFPSCKRIQLILNMFEIVDLKSNLKLIYESDKASFKNFTRSIKCVLTQLISGWKFKEVLKLIDEIEIYFDHSKLLFLTITKEYGLMRQDEQYLRYFYRKIIFESFEDNSARAKWLIYFLDYHTNFTSDEYQKLTYQAKLLLLLFAPIFQEENSNVVYIDWFSFSTFIFLTEGLEYLGFALKLLNSLKPKLRPDVCRIFIAVTNIGLFWLFENSSTLLYHCGLSVSKQVIDHIWKRDKLGHLVKYLTNMFIVESKLLSLNKLPPEDKIMSPIYDHLKVNFVAFNFEGLLSLIATEFLSMIRTVDRLLDDREYLDSSEIAYGIFQFYELRLLKKNLISSYGSLNLPKNLNES